MRNVVADLAVESEALLWLSLRLTAALEADDSRRLLSRICTPVADAFCASRLDGDRGQAFGTLPDGLDTQAIVDRARVA